MANVSETLYQTAISRIPQTNYLTATTPGASSFVEQVVSSPALINARPITADNSGYSTGNRFANESWTTGWTTEGSWEFFLTSQNVGRYLYGALGGYAVAAVSGSLGAYKHTFTPMSLSASAQLPSYSILSQLSPGSSYINSLFPSNVISSFSMRSEGQSRVMGALSFIGSGEETTPSGATWSTHVTGTQGTQDNFYHTQSTILVAEDDNSAAGFSTCEVAAWSFGINNTFADGDYGCPRFKDSGNRESGAIRSHLLLAGTTFDFEFTMRLRASDPAYQMLIDQTETEIVVSLTGDAIGATVTDHKMDITMNLTKYQSAERGFRDGFAYITIRPTLMYSNTASQIMKVELYNNIASYAT